MNVAVTTEHRFLRTPDGAVWTDGTLSYDFWTRYLSVFDRVRIVARVRDVPSAAGRRLATGPGVTCSPVTNYLGPWEYLCRWFQVGLDLRPAVEPGDAVILRVSSQIAGRLEARLHAGGHPYALEVVNDPFDVFAPGAVRYCARPLFRWWFTRQLQRQAQRAIGAAYVTAEALQRRYPCPGYSVGLSDVEIPPEALVISPRPLARERRSFRLITVASLAQMYKAPDVLLRAVAECVSAGLDLRLEIVGDGKHRLELECLAAQLGLADRVNFAGQVPSGSGVRARLDRADLFVLPSHCEGLPRAMVEAMARALPCIGTQVGGIPELLDSRDLVPPGDSHALACKIQEVLAGLPRLVEMSAHNLAKARLYRDELLASRRRDFFRHVQQATAAWLETSSRVRSLRKAPSAGY